MSKRSMFFVDGYNLYHSIDNNPKYHKYKWLNLRELALQFSKPPYEELRCVKYFSAYAAWKPHASVLRHKAYISALQSVNVEIILGRFQEKTQVCRAKSGCGKTFLTHEEKLTDVNIAISILESCIKNEVDILYLISGDNDLVPALEAARRICRNIDITVVLPINARAKTITQICHNNNYTVTKINETFLANSQFPDTITLNGKPYQRPSHWE